MSKYKSIVAVTNEAMAGALSLPENVSIEHVVYDAERQVIKYILSSTEQVEGYTVPVAEAAQIPYIEFEMTGKGEKTDA